MTRIENRLEKLEQTLNRPETMTDYIQCPVRIRLAEILGTTPAAMWEAGKYRLNDEENKIRLKAIFEEQHS